MQREKAKYKA